jgi:hypothetical protein
MKPRYHARSAVVAVALTQLVIADGENCYTKVLSTVCRVDQDMTFANNCVGISYGVHSASICDARDGECGRTDCSTQQVEVKRTDFTMIPYQGICTSPLTAIGPTPDGYCTIGVLAGDQCGYCPPPPPES